MAVQINVAANQAALTASIQAGVQAYNQRFAQNNQLNLTVNQRAFSQPLGRMTGDVKDFEAALAASNARVIAFGASTAVLGGVIRSFKELANVTIEVEKNLADINRVFGLTTSQLQKFSTDLFNVTKQTASSFNDASQAALEFSRQGLKAEETLQRTKDALTLTRLAGISTANAVDALTSTVNGFSATGVTTTQILNKLVAVEQDFAVGAGDLAEALSRTGQAAQEAGVSLDQLNALVTSAQQSTARGGAVIGNALKTIFTRLQRTDTLDQLEAFNIAVRDVQGNILPAVTILQNFAGAYSNLADAQRAQLSEQVAGVYQVNILKAIVNDLNKSQGVYAGALQRGAMATNEAEIATAKLNQTLDALLKQTATSTQQLANNIGKVTFEPLARYGTEQLKSLVESMNEILEGEGIGSTFANGLLKGIRNVIAGPGAIAAFFTLFKLIQNSFTYLSQALPQIAGITTETQNRKNIEQAILQIMSQQGPVAQALTGTMGNQAAQAQLLLQVARQQTAEYQTQTTLARQLAGQLAGQGVRVRGAGGLQVTRAGGYIPASTKMAEVVGAQAGGYAPGKVVKSPVGGVMNTAEDVKYVPGFAQPFINPPANSKAGRTHRQKSINRTGIDPYMNSGFIPNFAITGLAAKDFDKEGQGEYKILAGRIFESLLRGESYLSLTENKVKADIDIGKYAIREAKLSGKAAYNDPNFGDGKLKGRCLVLPKTASTDYDQRLEQNKNADIFRAPYTHANLFARSKKIIERERKNKTTDPSNIPLFDGFIPNFATPMTTASIPWFKKYSSKYKNAAGDTDLFKMGDFPTYGRGLDHEYAKKGNSAMLSYLHEDFVRSALNIALGSKKVIRPAEVGFKNKPVSDISNENDFDLLYRIADGSYSMLELKQDFKNISGSVTGFMNKKLANLEKENPVLAKKVSSMIAVSNRPKFTDPTGRNAGANFSEFEMAAASIVKDKYSNVDPSISAKLTKVTDGLLRRYEAKKNSFSKGFIPNFASMISSSIKGKGNISAIKTGKNNYEIEGVEVGKKFRGQGLGSQLYNTIVQKIGSGNTIKSVLLPQEQALSDYASGKNIPAKAIFPQLSWAKAAKNSKLLVNGKEIAISDFESGIASHKYNAAKLDMALIELVNSHASGFIPNFAYKQAVMGLEESMSGNKAIFDTKPFPHIRNSSQPTFSSAIADHGGLTNAMSDSMRGQKAAGLMNDGFIPNFANSRSAKRRIQRNQQSQQSTNLGGGASFNPQQIANEAEKLAKNALRKINNAYQYIAVFGADFADIIENASKSATAKLKTSSANVKTSVGNLSNNLKQSFGGMFGKGQSSGGSKPPVMASGPNVGMFSKISGGLSKTFSNPILAMILPQITGAVASQFAYGNKKRYELTESERKKQSFANTGVTSISTGAYIGNMILPGWGAAIGAAVGGLIAFSEATKAAKLTIGEMKEKIYETNAKQSSATSDYKSNIELLASAVETGDEVSKAKYTKDLVYSLSSISDQNLNKTVEGKSPKQLEFLISDMNKKAAMQTAVLSASEKLKTGGKEVSFFDRFKQQTSEAIFEFSDTIIDMFKFVGNSIVDGFKYVAESTSKIWTFIVDKIKDPFFNFIDGLKESFSNLSDFLGSSLNMVMLGFQQYANDIKSFFGFGNEESQKNLDKLSAANRDYEDALKKLTESIKKGLSKGMDLGLKGLDIATYINQNYSAYGMLSQSRERKTQNYKMQDVVSEYVGAGGGAGTSSFFGKIFGTGDKKNELDKYLFDLIKTVGKSGMAKDREAALEELRGNLIDKGLAGDEIDVLLTSLRKFGETGNYKGQYILSHFEEFVTQLTAVDVTMQKTADQIAKDFGDFLKLKQSIEKNVNEYINQSKLNEVDLAANVQRQKISIEEKGRMSEFLGKPFKSAQYRDQSARLDINKEFQQAERDQINQSMNMIADLNKKLNYTSLGSLKKLEESLISQNYTLEQRLQKNKRICEKI